MCICLYIYRLLLDLDSHTYLYIYIYMYMFAHRHILLSHACAFCLSNSDMLCLQMHFKAHLCWLCQGRAVVSCGHSSWRHGRGGTSSKGVANKGVCLEHLNMTIVWQRMVSDLIHGSRTIWRKFRRWHPEPRQHITKWGIQGSQKWLKIWNVATSQILLPTCSDYVTISSLWCSRELYVYIHVYHIKGAPNYLNLQKHIIWCCNININVA